MDEDGANCPLANVITTESKCTTAANQLQMGYIGSHRDKNFPAGCMATINGFYFNTMTNPSKTSPDKGDYAVCRTGILVYLSIRAICD